MKELVVKLVTTHAYGVILNGEVVYQTGDVKSIVRYCKNHFGIDIPTKVENTRVGMAIRFDGMKREGFVYNI